MDSTLSAADAAKATVAYYNEHAADFTADEGVLNANEVVLSVRMQMVDDPLVLGIGCGSGREILPLLQMGIKHYIGVDPSEGMLAIARKNWPDYDFRIGDACNLQSVVTEKFDAFFMIAMLMHIPRERVDEAFQSVRSVLKEGAIGNITVPVGDGTAILTPENSSMVPPGHALLVECWTEQALTPHLERNGFRVIEPTYVEEEHGMLMVTVQAI